jgi:hypothetical protein
VTAAAGTEHGPCKIVRQVPFDLDKFKTFAYIRFMKTTVGSQTHLMNPAQFAAMLARRAK